MGGVTVEPNKVDVRSYYVRHRNAMAAYGDLGGIYEDYYLHLMQVGLRPEPAQDEMLKDLLAALALHLAARPQNEMSAWTLNFRDPPLNLFATGDSQVGNVVGRLFTEDVKVADKNLFFAQATRPRSPARKSTVEVEGRDVLRIVEQYYAQSEQLPARLFRMGGDAYAIVVAQPDIDMEWFDGLDTEAVRALEKDEELRLLEKRVYHFGCGCNLEMILNVLVSAFQGDSAQIFGEDPQIEVKCPRCAGVFTIDPPTLEAFIARLEDETDG